MTAAFMLSAHSAVGQVALARGVSSRGAPTESASPRCRRHRVWARGLWLRPRPTCDASRCIITARPETGRHYQLLRSDRIFP